MWEIRVNKNTESQSINAEHIEAGLFSALLHMIILCWFLWSTEPTDIDQFSDTEVRELAGKHDLDDAVVEILVELAKKSVQAEEMSAQLRHNSYVPLLNLLTSDLLF